LNATAPLGPFAAQIAGLGSGAETRLNKQRRFEYSIVWFTTRPEQTRSGSTRPAENQRALRVMGQQP
jgi:hypothetical protein